MDKLTWIRNKVKHAQHEFYAIFNGQTQETIWMPDPAFAIREYRSYGDMSLFPATHIVSAMLSYEQSSLLNKRHEQHAKRVL